MERQLLRLLKYRTLVKPEDLVDVYNGFKLFELSLLIRQNGYLPEADDAYFPSQKSQKYNVKPLSLSPVQNISTLNQVCDHSDLVYATISDNHNINDNRLSLIMTTSLSLNSLSSSSSDETLAQDSSDSIEETKDKNTSFLYKAFDDSDYINGSLYCVNNLSEKCEISEKTMMTVLGENSNV
ncbi:hypothetical protein G6F57_009926 [Rhizopus arrhizus]|uniref:Uncharacterized protein n=1 Tax=Rhizopus oryzae TaxID=64495 RepID=A0A9P6X906_RHIOR|nr:hypothetical protein G6F23_008008 [Rhizopus arrhizus]KAG1413281.1 hypothetical protein G6F58_007579 [Rhizopus delemar]KAG0757276.1 hypothetical protein G6F24_010592 [Rhizopus arrhizus]KAG0782644.1 hypothetical protein G6F21_011000 [Rhizopus arrhizus]KAG0790773.1 hypothetical protein G6F22_006321 [Rhizopus arrhizus]